MIFNLLHIIATVICFVLFPETTSLMKRLFAANEQNSQKEYMQPVRFNYKANKSKVLPSLRFVEDNFENMLSNYYTPSHCVRPSEAIFVRTITPQDLIKGLLKLHRSH